MKKMMKNKAFAQRVRKYARNLNISYSGLEKDTKLIF